MTTVLVLPGALQYAVHVLRRGGHSWCVKNASVSPVWWKTWALIPPLPLSSFQALSRSLPRSVSPRRAHPTVASSAGGGSCWRPRGLSSHLLSEESSSEAWRVDSTGFRTKRHLHQGPKRPPKHKDPTFWF